MICLIQGTGVGLVYVEASRDGSQVTIQPTELGHRPAGARNYKGLETSTKLSEGACAVENIAGGNGLGLMAGEILGEPEGTIVEGPYIDRLIQGGNKEVAQMMVNAALAVVEQFYIAYHAGSFQSNGYDPEDIEYVIHGSWGKSPGYMKVVAQIMQQVMGFEPKLKFTEKAHPDVNLDAKGAVYLGEGVILPEQRKMKNP